MLRTFLSGIPASTLVLLLSSVAAAQFEKGDYVVVTEKVVLRVPEGKTDTLVRGSTVRIDEINGKWLWVKRDKKGRPGWIDSAKVIRPDDALALFNEQIRKNPKDAEAYYARGQQAPMIFAPGPDGRTNQHALDDLNEAIRLGYKSSDIYVQRTLLHLFIDEVENVDKMVQDLNEAIRLDPNNAEAYEVRVEILLGTGEYAKGLADMQTLLRLEPKEPLSHSSFAMFRASCPDAKFRNGKEAVAAATRACELAKWKDAVSLDALAAAWAESGNFDKAIDFATKAIATTELDNQRMDFESRLALYKEKKPYRSPPPELPPEKKEK